MTDTISPCDCPHPAPLFVTHRDQSPPPERFNVTVCPDCGQFLVTGRKAGKKEEVSYRVTFDLPTPELVAAAGRYLAHLNATAVKVGDLQVLPLATEAYPGELALLRALNTHLRGQRDRLFDWMLGRNIALCRTRQAAVRKTIRQMTTPYRIDENIQAILADQDRRAMLGQPPEDRENPDAKVEIPKGDVEL